MATTKTKATTKVTTAEPRKLGKFDRAVLDLSGKEVEVVTLPKEIFGAEVNTVLLTQAVRIFQANQRQGNASTKTRAEVRGGGKKPWRQKGTGRARQGSIRSPLWVGGGITFGPKTRDFSMKLTTKMRQAALRSALSSKLESVMVIKDFNLKEPKTKLVAAALTKLGLTGKTLVILPEYSKDALQASRNLPRVSLTTVGNLNTYQVLTADKLVLAKDSLAKFGKTDDAT